MDDHNYDKKYRIAVASSDGIVVNSHFGRAEAFYIYEVCPEGKIDFVEKRDLLPVCQGGNHDDIRMADSADRLVDCAYILVSRIGPGAVNALEERGIVPMELPGMVEESIHRLINYRELQMLLNQELQG